MPEPITNALTIDLEDYFHVQAFAEQIPPSRWNEFESRVVECTSRLLRLLDAHQVYGTFFVLGWLADRHPDLIRRIHDAGHEIGCHSFWHRLVYSQDPDSFRCDLQQATQAIEAITGERPRAYRAPSFSITDRSRWALEILVEEGYQIDSSIFPIRHDTYGVVDAEPGVHRIDTPAGAIWEIPPTVRCFRRFNVPVGGGGYLRLYPKALSLRWLKGVNAAERRPFVVYVHPWELDPEQPRIATNWRSRFRHYQNLRTTEPKLLALLEQFRFGPISELVGSSPSQETDRPRQERTPHWRTPHTLGTEAK